MMTTITQVKLTFGILSELPNYGYDKEAYMVGTMYDIRNAYWRCEFSHMSLKQISEVILEFFSSHCIDASQVKFNFGDTEIVVDKNNQNTSAHYLDIITSQINIG